MKKNTIIKLIIGTILVAIIGFAIYNYFIKEDEDSTLTLSEKQWIESNKNNVYDISINTNIPVFTKAGSGVIFDFITDFETNTNLEVNEVPTTKDTESLEYSFEIRDVVGENELLIYTDNYVLLSKENKTYLNNDKIKDITIGVLKSDLEKVESHLGATNGVKYQTFDTIDELITAVNGDEVNAISIPKMLYLDVVVKNDNLYVNYNIESLKNHYVITLGEDDKFNTIITKYVNKWMNDSYKESFMKNINNTYLANTNIDESTKSAFSSKEYIFGYVENTPYITNNEGKLYGYNINQVNNFANTADITINYAAYDTNEALINAINSNEIDFVYNDMNEIDYKTDMYHTSSVTEEDLVIVSDYKDKLEASNLMSLVGSKVVTVKNSSIEEALESIGVEVISYNNVDSAIKNMDKGEYLVIDMNNYQYYKHNLLSDIKVNAIVDFGHNGYTIRDIKDNELFTQYFNFYISMINDENNIDNNVYTLISLGNKPTIFKNIIVFVLAIIIIGLGYLGIKKYKEIKDSGPVVSKTDKLKYIDSLTSLKNRTFLNDNIDDWDNSEVYPQSIIVLDLNNIAYINDNFGHGEGDKIIKEAANKLITTQVENSEIIRSNGNEFIIYLVGHSEKQVIAYIRKLNKEMKDLTHNYGAAIGYSMINDAIKTIDDAVNEATLDMRNNKEEISN